MSITDPAAQTSRGLAFRALHEGPGAFVIPNPWDAGSASILASMGYKALATTSAGLAFSLARPDGEGAVSRQEALDNARVIIEASGLPVSADLENGYGDEPEACAETIRLAIRTGLSGASIEDATGREDSPIYPFELSVERIRAAAQTVKTLGIPFMLTARAENYFHGRPDLNNTIRRLQAYAEAGANVLYAPGLQTREEIESVVRAVAPLPVNVLLTNAQAGLSVEELSAMGVRRISLGGSLARAAYGAFLRAAEEIWQQHHFTYVPQTVPHSTFNELFSKK